MGYDKDDVAKDEPAYDPYYNLYQLAAVTDTLIKLTGKFPEDDIFSSDNATWRIWSNFFGQTLLLV